VLPSQRYKTYSRSRSFRLHGFDYRRPGPYHLILGTYERHPLFADPTLAEEMMALLLEGARHAGATLYAYCVMPDHMHLLVAPRVGEDVSGFVRRFKGRATRLHRRLGGEGRLWQRGFYDHILRKEEDVRRIARYILGNPVRKGLVQSIVEYPYSGSLVFRKEDL